MKLALTILIGCVVLATSLCLARGGPGAGAGIGNGASHGNPSAPASPSQNVNSNGRLSGDRDHGVERAEDRMSEEGRENTNGPMSPNRAKGKARSSQRHIQHQPSDEPERK